MKELAVQSSNDTNTAEDRAEIQKEIDQLKTEITRIADQTEFNTKKLLNGELAASGTGGAGGTDASITTPTGDISIITGVEIAGKSEYVGDFTLTVETNDSSVTTVTLTDGDALTVTKTITSVDDPITVGDITFTLDELPGDESSVAVAFTATAHVAAAEGGEGDAEASAGLKFHIGANKDQNISLTIESMKAEDIGIGSIDLKTQDGANAAIETIDDAINLVSEQRAYLGAVQNRLEHTVNNLGTTSENLTAAEARIRDVDMAKEMMEFTKNNILSQASQAMLAQANMQPQSVLQLLQ